jgi:hypothetical protein
MTVLLTAVSILIALAALVAQFFFKWVPNPEDQKRHLKRAGIRVGYFLLVCGSVASLILLSKDKAPVTAGFVVQVALASCSVSLVVTLVLMQALLRLFGSYSDTLGMDGFLGLTKEIVNCLGLIADDPNLSAETARTLRAVLYGASATQKIKGQQDPN